MGGMTWRIERRVQGEGRVLPRLVPWLVGLASLASVSCKKDERPGVFVAEEEIPNPNVPHERLPEQSSAFTETVCETKVPGFVTQCGIVEVPGSPGTDRRISIAVARVFTPSNEAKDDPIVYLDGGPGGPSLASIEYLHSALRKMSFDRDFVFIDQRGVGQSVPNLQCTEGGEVLQALDGCYERLTTGIDLDNFNSIQNARDIDLVRQAFGYDEWNLMGISYGTRLALTVMRDYPEGVRSALIDSVVPLQSDLLAEIGQNGYEAFLRAFDACAADPDCSVAYPDPLEELLELTQRLNDSPQEIGRFDLSGDDFVALSFQLLYSPSTIGLVPKMIHDAYEGDFSLFENLGTAVSSGPGISFGMHLSLHCSEEVPFTSVEAFDSFDAAVPEVLRNALSGRVYLDYCEHWPVAPAPASENEPVVSDIPTLVVAGFFDPITPPHFAEAAAMFLENSSYFLVENESHGASLGECGVALGKSFFADPSSELDATCLASLPGLEFEARGISGFGVKSPIDFVTGEVSPEQVEKAKEDLRLRLR